MLWGGTQYSVKMVLGSGIGKHMAVPAVGRVTSAAFGHVGAGQRITEVLMERPLESSPAAACAY